MKLGELLDLIDLSREGNDVIQLVSRDDGWDRYTEFTIDSEFLTPFEDWTVLTIEAQGLKVLRIEVEKNGQV